jgi:hypothetical protein
MVVPFREGKSDGPFAERHHGPPWKEYCAQTAVQEKQLSAALHFVSSSIRPQADLVQHALGAGSPVSSLYSKLRGRAA